MPERWQRAAESPGRLQAPMMGPCIRGKRSGGRRPGTSFYLADPSSVAAGQQLKCLQNQTGAVNMDQMGDNRERWGVWEPDPSNGDSCSTTAADCLTLTRQECRLGVANSSDFKVSRESGPLHEIPVPILYKKKTNHCSPNIKHVRELDRCGLWVMRLNMVEGA